jgi:nickel transport protein
MRIVLWIIGVLLPTVMPNILFAHGMEHTITREQTVVIRAAYDDGEPMSYADVKIYAPGNAQIEPQNGRTDKHGCFAFIPDGPGQWRLTVDGGMGHMITTDVTVDDALAPVVDLSANRPLPRLYGIITGLAFILGLTGLAAWRKSRKKTA